MAAAVAEMSHHDEFDYLVVNDAFETALGELAAILTGGRLRTDRQRHALAALIDELLA
jgi:guanylate kinase